MFAILWFKIAVIITAILLIGVVAVITYFHIVGARRGVNPDDIKSDSWKMFWRFIALLAVTWLMAAAIGGVFSKNEEKFDASAACEAAKVELLSTVDFLTEEQRNILLAEKLEKIEELKNSDLSEDELTKKLIEIKERPNDVTLISGEGFLPANWSNLKADTYWNMALKLANPEKGNCPLVLAHIIALPERWGTYNFTIDGWTVGKDKEFANSENELADKFIADLKLYQSAFDKLANLNLELKEVNGAYIVLDEVQGNKATYLGKEGKGDFVEIYRKDKLGNETLFSRLYKTCGNNAEKKATTSTPATKKVDPTPVTPTPTSVTYTFKLVYDANGGKNPPVSETKTSTSSATMNFKLSSDKPTRSGYVFKGWSLEKVTPSKWSSAKIITEASVEANKTVTVYAVWKEKSSGGGNSSSGDGCPASEVSKSSVAEGSTGGYTENANKDAGHTGVDTGKNGPSDPGSGAGVKTDSNGNQVGTSGTSNSSSGGSANSGTSGATSDSNGSTGTIKDPAGIDISDEDF